MTASQACSVLLLLTACSAGAELALSRADFDAKERALSSKRDVTTASADSFAWGESYLMRAYVEMYEATQDPVYLDRLGTLAEQIIATRDDRKAAREGRTARPFWSLGGKFTVARLTLNDSAGRAAIALRSIRSGSNNKTLVEVAAGPEPGVFSLTTSSEVYKRSRGSNITYKDLSLDPASPRYFPRVVNHPNYIVDPDFRRAEATDAIPSLLLVAEDIRERKSAATQLAACDPTFLVPDVIQYYGYTGPIFSAMTRFAALVYTDAQLQPRFKAAATRLLLAAKESVDAWEPCWRDGPNPGEGYYLSVEKGGGLWWDGVMAPMNYLGAVGQVLLNLHECLGDERALAHARAIATLFRNDCRLDENGAYVFGYWPKVAMDRWRRENALSANTPHYPTASSADDLSHGAWTVEFAVMCHARGVVFSREDMDRFARTFTQNLWRGPDDDGSLHFALRVDGDRVCKAGSDIAGARWLDLCPYAPDVFELNRRVWEANTLYRAGYGHALCGYARMFRWQKELARAPRAR